MISVHACEKFISNRTKYKDHGVFKYDSSYLPVDSVRNYCLVDFINLDAREMLDRYSDKIGEEIFGMIGYGKGSIMWKDHPMGSYFEIDVPMVNDNYAGQKPDSESNIGKWENNLRRCGCQVLPPHHHVIDPETGDALVHGHARCEVEQKSCVERYTLEEP